MMMEEITKGERGNIEYKVDIPPKSENYMRTVVAYANANGGRLVFGVENNTWRVTGFTREEVFQKMDAVTNAIYDSCEPKITPSVEIQELEGKYIIVVDVPAGMQRPYCVKSQGIMEGVYLRVSGTTRKAALYQIQEMVLSARNRSFDSEKVERELSEDEMNAFCDRIYHHARDLCSDEKAKKALKRIGISQLISFKVVCEEAGKYYATNGYQLLDGRLEEYPDAAIQCAVFKGTSRNIFITRKEFTGCIDEEVESAYAFVLEHINLGARIDGLARQDIYELPIRSIREIITNAVCHRSYLCPGKIQVAIFDDRLEVTSPGMLDKDLTIKKMKAGISKIRNGVIAKIFAYMNLIEAWGTGIPKIFEETKDYGLREPELQDMGSDFRINLYRKEMMFDAYGVVAPKSFVKEDSSYMQTKNAVTIDSDNIDTVVTQNDIKFGTNGVNGTKFIAKSGTNGTNGTKFITKSDANGANNTKFITKSDANGTKFIAKPGTNGTILNENTVAEERLISAIRADGAITQKQMSQKTGLSLRTVKRMTVELQKMGKIVRIGNNRSGKWQVKD